MSIFIIPEHVAEVIVHLERTCSGDSQGKNYTRTLQLRTGDDLSFDYELLCAEHGTPARFDLSTAIERCSRRPMWSGSKCCSRARPRIAGREPGRRPLTFSTGGKVQIVFKRPPQPY